ncbi:hypothetical protein VOLCADRAFT_97249 [Volvox carteri f. nagariensis]|uniref:Rubisco LSMT substrate-binding domain-containing protein n=1 Tax=Volvox carteri f. nagariensis TaxID=3068 RepID=D8UC90_VOLCA|nr:uncharacterized protein VOLCADRAFT_97249 [Volvox carteri f. nagariensis]EFJ42603.1 hypothetical protein VOLCADRAFT_97249 [Volvox carteri f. nagariensis]|eukprot:XP_002956254.1 hypothetical protein VOLCADRAFT_97249 [Volvox carteri f. nagariensis]
MQQSSRPISSNPPTMRRSRPAPPRWPARRPPPPEDDIEDMTVEQRLERLSQLSGRVGEMRSVFDRESLLRQMGALDPALYAPPQPSRKKISTEEAIEEGEEEEDVDDDRPLEWIEWNDDPLTHVVNNTIIERLPDGMRRRLRLARDADEDEAVISVPLHNCLSVYICEGLEVQDSLERQEAAADFSRMQLAFLERWAVYHGPMPPALVDFLCDFSFDSPPARAKMALWVLWLAETGSDYWREVLGALTPPEDMPHVEFCTDDELMELQWMPYALPISIRREALRTFWEYFGASPLAEGMGWQRTSEVDPLDPEGSSAAAAAAAAGERSPEPLRPLPPFERFLWAYCHSEARSLGNGERVVFFPLADPCIYTTEPTTINTTLAVVADDGPTLDEFAVLATLRPLQKGELLHAHAPFGEGVAEGGGGATSQLHTQFGMVPELGGNEADLQDLQPETGSLDDDWLKRLLGQEASTRLDLITDPKLRHLLTLAESGDADMNQMPPTRRILPPLQLPKLWGPGLVAGVKRLRLDERYIEPTDWEREAIEQSLAEEERTAEAMAAERQAAGFATGGTEGVSYKEYDEWKEDMRSREIVEVPGDITILETDEGRAEWRRLKAAWHSLPRVAPDNKEHGNRMELALQGAPLAQVFSTPRDITRELAAAEAVLSALNRVQAAFPTTIEQDEQLIASAAAAAAAGRAKRGASGASAKGSENSGESLTAAASAALAEAEAAAAAEPPPPPRTAITTARMLGVVAWRLELKRVWRQMAGMVQEYRDALLVAEATATAAATAMGTGEPVAAA